MNGNKYSISIRTPHDAPPEYFARQLETGRRQAGNKLYEILYSQKLPAVVDIEEVSMPFSPYSSHSFFYPERELRIEITVTLVTHKHVVVPSFYSDFTHVVRDSLLVRIKRWFSKVAR